MHSAPLLRNARTALSAQALLVGALSILGCGAPARAAPVTPSLDAPAPREPAAPAQGARWFEVEPGSAFEVTRAEGLHRLVDGGVRLELDARGEVRQSTWDRFDHGEALRGSLAVAPHLGDGFLHWTEARLFRSQAFSGPLEPIGARRAGRILGARSGLAAVVVLTETGPLEVAPGAPRATPLAAAGIADLVATGPSVAARLDVFGRREATTDGGARWVEEPALATAPLAAPEPAGSTPRLTGSLALRAAVLAGADLGDGTAAAVVQGAALRVDLQTGAARRMGEGSLPEGSVCEAVKLDRGAGFVCAARTGESGAFVLVSARGEPPRLERAFAGGGAFAGGDAGALSYLGPCAGDPRGEPRDPEPAICVRRGPDDWVEHRLEPGNTAAVVAWIPRADGGAVALVAPDTAPLPPAVGAPPAIDRGALRIVSLPAELEAWASQRTAASEHAAIVDRTLRSLADGTLDVWVRRGDLSAGVTVDAEGRALVHDPPPDLAAMSTTGAYGVAITRGGALHETRDHGRTWQPAGRSPIPPEAFRGGCSALGCALGSFARVGWGEAPGELTQRDPPARATLLAERLPRLTCTPRGLPASERAPGAESLPGAGDGDVLELLARGAPPGRTVALAPRRAMILARRDDGALGALVLDGDAPGSVAAATIDPSGAPGPLEPLAPWSSLAAAGSPACAPDRASWRALVPIDPVAWLDLDPAALPGVTLGRQGAVLVRWGRARVCIEAADLGARDERRAPAELSRLVLRWTADRAQGALRSPELLQNVDCALSPDG